jgi:hypothetical protein
MKKDLGRDNPSYCRGIDHRHWEMPLDPELPDYAGVKTEAPKLFDLIEDPGERRDLASQRPDLVEDLAARYDAWFRDVFAEWVTSNQEIREHDRAYWKDRVPPDPRALFHDYWQWKRSDADPEKDDPLEVFTGYWTRPGQ